jgi:hypothetical protein
MNVPSRFSMDLPYICSIHNTSWLLACRLLEEDLLKLLVGFRLLVAV